MKGFKDYSMHENTTRISIKKKINCADLFVIFARSPRSSLPGKPKKTFKVLKYDRNDRNSPHIIDLERYDT